MNYKTDENIEEVKYKTHHSSHISALTFKKEITNNPEKVILFIHGWLDNAASFMPVFEFLQKNKIEGYQYIAIDLPGHGASSNKSEGMHYHFVDWIYDILVLFEKNNWVDVHLVGHSMGGMISSAFSAVFPEKVKSLTLIDSIGMLTYKEEETTSILRKGFLSRIKEPSKRVKTLTLDKATQARVLISDLEYKDAEMIVSRNLKETDAGLEWRSDRKLSLTSPYRMSLTQCKQVISDIKAPVQVLYGSNGLAMIRDNLDVFTPLMSCKNIIELEGGHHVHMEKPEKTANLITEFILSL